MRRSLVTVGAATLGILAGCGSSTPPTDTPPAAPTSAAAAPAPPANAAPTAPGVPALSGNPTDVTKETRAGAGAGQPPTTLVTRDIVVGKGAAATPANTVEVRYSGTLYSTGAPFDSSWSRGDAPVSFPLDQVVPGFSQGIAGMQPGGRRVIVIPPALGYGDEDSGPVPAGSTLVFVVDLVAVS